ncbi:MAG: 3'(2'),5'-bisphosphate nucleotidase CysQ [Paracoccaceae bacterium]
MPESDQALLIDAARAASEIAMPYWRQTHKSWEKAAGAGPVTEADLAVDEMLKDRLLAARPGYGWLSEETDDDAARLTRDHVFIVDPIDGTRAFMAGERTWAHSLAVAHQGQIVAAAIYLPAHDKLYTAATDDGARLNGQPVRTSSRADLQDATILAAKPNFDPRHWPIGLPPVRRQFRASLAYRLALVAEGRFDAMLTFRDTWEWDVAAGSLIVKEAGGVVTERYGASPKFNNPMPVLPGLLAAGPLVHRELRHYIGDKTSLGQHDRRLP